MDSLDRLFHCILAPLDDSTCAQRALVHALSMAHAFRSEVRLLHVIEQPGIMECLDIDDLPYGTSLESALAEMQQEAEQYLAALSAERHEVEVAMRHRTCQAPAAASAILQEVSEEAIDLVVIGTSGRGGEMLSEVGDTAGKVVRKAPCPVLTVGSTGGRAPEFIQRILVPFDFSPSARRALRLAESVARALDAELLVLHVIEPFVHPLFFRDHSKTFALRTPITPRQVEEKLRELVRDEGITIRHRVLAECARPVDGILALGRRYDAHLIVQGARGRTSDDETTLGSVAMEVVRRAQRPVITVKGVPETHWASAPA